MTWSALGSRLRDPLAARSLARAHAATPARIQLLLLVDNDGPGAAITDRGGGAEEVDHPQRVIVAVSTVTLPLTVVRPMKSSPGQRSLGARLSREHNNANVICLGGKILGEWQAVECVRAFQQTAYVEERHQHRVEMLATIGNPGC